MENVAVARVIRTFQLHHGVMSHEAARYVEKSGYHFYSSQAIHGVQAESEISELLLVQPSRNETIKAALEPIVLQVSPRSSQLGGAQSCASRAAQASTADAAAELPPSITQPAKAKPTEKQRAIQMKPIATDQFKKVQRPGETATEPKPMDV